MVEEFVKQLNILYYACVDSFPRWDDFFEDSLTNLIHQLDLFQLLTDNTKLYIYNHNINKKIAFEYAYGITYSYVGELGPLALTLKALLVIKQEWKFSLNLLSTVPDYLTDLKFELLVDKMFSIFDNDTISNIISNTFNMGQYPFNFVFNIIKKYEFFKFMAPLVYSHAEYYEYMTKYNYYGGDTYMNGRVYDSFCIKGEYPHIPQVFTSHISSVKFKKYIFKDYSSDGGSWDTLNIGNTIFLCKAVTTTRHQYGETSYYKILMDSISSWTTSFK